MNSRNKAVHTALDPDLDTIDVPASLIGICCRGRHAWCGRSLRPPRSRRERRAQCGDEGLHGSLLRERCQTICRDARKINRWPARTIKLSFRKLNSNLSEQVGRAAGSPRAALRMTQVSRSFACFEETDLASATVGIPTFAIGSHRYNGDDQRSMVLCRTGLCATAVLGPIAG